MYVPKLHAKLRSTHAVSFPELYLSDSYRSVKDLMQIFNTRELWVLPIWATKGLEEEFFDRPLKSPP